MSYTDEIIKLFRLFGLSRSLSEYMTPQMMQVLLHVAHRPGCTMQELTEATGLALSSVSRNLTALGEWHRLGKEGLGLVETIDDPVERRRKIVFLTPKGRAFCADLISVLRPGEIVALKSPTAKEHLNAVNGPWQRAG